MKFNWMASVDLCCLTPKIHGSDSYCNSPVKEVEVKNERLPKRTQLIWCEILKSTNFSRHVSVSVSGKGRFHDLI